MSKVTLRTIAEKSGMSKYAVSRALAGKDGVSEATRQRILEIADSLGYKRPSPQMSQTREIVALFDDPLNVNTELHTQILGGLQQEASRLAMLVRVHWLHHELPLEQVFKNSLGVAAVNLSQKHELKLMRDLDIPVVYTVRPEPFFPADVVSGADQESGAAVAEYLIGLGHREIVYVHGREDLRGRILRLNGLRDIIERADGVSLHDLRWKDVGGFSDAFSEHLESGGRPTALFCAHDGLALNAVTDLLSRGWKVPQDISVIGFGDYSVARQIRPALTTVKTKGHEIGRALMRLLHHRLSDDHWPEATMRIQIVNDLLVRGSCGSAPVVHPLDRT
ncbi:LacI family DNA-binding transcriptional regulator [Amaricoccus tamworthensis]|uniref:LacI family DNA-binding transcriptional regulator n=1 Tax=Amaricoccus tamworthensis TaxID=57002 RepID=UPI003C7BF79D